MKFLLSFIYFLHTVLMVIIMFVFWPIGFLASQIHAGLSIGYWDGIKFSLNSLKEFK